VKSVFIAGRAKIHQGGGLNIINSVLSILFMYIMSFFKIPRGVLKKLDYFLFRFFLAM
jgi:hypothetical protein